MNPDQLAEIRKALPKMTPEEQVRSLPRDAEALKSLLPLPVHHRRLLDSLHVVGCNPLPGEVQANFPQFMATSPEEKIQTLLLGLSKWDAMHGVAPTKAPTPVRTPATTTPRAPIPSTVAKSPVAPQTDPQVPTGDVMGPSPQSVLVPLLQEVLERLKDAQAELNSVQTKVEELSARANASDRALQLIAGLVYAGFENVLQANEFAEHAMETGAQLLDNLGKS